MERISNPSWLNQTCRDGQPYTKAFFQSLNKWISSFLWDGKHPRIRRKLLERPKKQGGLALPNLRNYYWASNILKVIYWYQSPETEWCQVEASSCISTSLSALITAKLPFPPSQYASNLVVQSTLKIWAQFRQHFKNFLTFLCSPISNNHLFPTARLDPTFTQWHRVGLIRCSDFYIDGLFGSFGDLTKKFKLQRSDLFRYFQVRHFIQTWSSTFPALPSNSELDGILRSPMQRKGQISNISNTICSFQKVSLDKLRTD